MNYDGVGSFAVVLYYDANGDHEFDPGDQIVGVFYLAEVQATVKQNTPIAVKMGTPYASIANDRVTVDGYTGSTNAIEESATVTLIGGGGNGTLGVSLIQTGWIGNMTSFSVTGRFTDTTNTTTLQRLKKT